MKYLIIMLFFITQTSVLSQQKASVALGYDYCQVNFNSLSFYIKTDEGFFQTNCGISTNTLVKHNTEKVATIEDSYNSKPVVKISEIDPDFDLVQAFKNKVFIYKNSIFKSFYYLKNDSVLVEQKMKKTNVWKLIRKKEDNIYKINVGPNKFVYWSVELGMIYKSNNNIQTSFLDINCKDKSNVFTLEDINSVNMESDYFEMGEYIVKKNKQLDFTVFKNKKKIIDHFPLIFYNNKQLITIEKKGMKFYNTNFKKDSLIRYRDLSQGGDRIEYLEDNDIKSFSIKDFRPANYDEENYGAFGCGNVTRYLLQIDGNKISETYDDSMTYNTGKSEPKNIVINTTVKFDSLIFMSRKKYMEWSINGGFDNRIILKKDGKEGLYSFKQENDTITLNEIVPIEFEKIYLISGSVFLKRDNTEDFLEYYLKNNKMRFVSVAITKSYYYLRYKKIDNKEGWLKSSEVLYEDL